MLLAGCILVFRKRAGIVLLHGGIALVMANELVVHTLHVEGQMQIREGETVNFVQDIRTIELAVIDPSDPKTDDVMVVPRCAARSEQDRFATSRCRSTFECDKYLQNSELEAAEARRPRTRPRPAPDCNGSAEPRRPARAPTPAARSTSRRPTSS